MDSVVKSLGRNDLKSQADPLGLTGQQIGRFSIQHPIGVGGVATVYQAFDDVRGHSVALKILHPDPDDNTYARFRREALNAGMLRHPHIVRIYQVGNTLRGGSAYIAMELVEGESLGQLLRRRNRLLPQESCGMLEPIAHALAFAHEADIVHRDVKPSNILLRSTRPGSEHSIMPESVDHPVVPLLSDFGIARFLDQPDLTFTGRTVGTPAYMAPEQCQGGRQVDQRADIYALGTVLYRCVTGRLPFSGSMTQILHAQVYEAVVIDAQMARELPPLVLTILQRALAKKPSERYASAAEFATDLHLVTKLDQVAARDGDTMTATLALPLNAPHTVDTQPASVTLVAGTERIDAPHLHAVQAGASRQFQRRDQNIAFVLAGLLLMIAVGAGYVLGMRDMFQVDAPVTSLAMQPAATVQASSTSSAGAANAIDPSRVPDVDANGANQEPTTDLAAAKIASISTLGSLPLTATVIVAPALTVTPAIIATVGEEKQPAPPNDARMTATPAEAVDSGESMIPTIQPSPIESRPLPSPAALNEAEPVATVCMYVIDEFFLAAKDGLSDEILAELKCPKAKAYQTSAALLLFEHGHMLRLDETAQIYVYYIEADAWEWTEAVAPEGASASPPPRDQPGLFVPTGDFGAIWTDPRRNSALGYALSERPEPLYAVVQIFPGGILAGSVEDGRLFIYLRSRLSF